MKTSSDSTTDEALVIDNRRHAHRVFLTPKYADRLNPFRHIAWIDPNDKSDPTQRPEPKKYKFPKGWRWALTFKFYEIRFSPGVQFKRTLLTSWINILLVCVPTGLTLQYVIGASPETFVCNYLAQIPLWFMCDYALEEIEFRIGRRAVDLVDIFTTNTVQIISSIILLKSNQVPILQTSLVGGILSNLLVLLGVSLLFGGVTNHQQSFNRIGAQGSSSLLSIAATSLLIPTAVKQLGQTTKPNLVLQSRGVAVVLLFVYLAYTYCQMVTHKVDYQDDGHHNLSSILLSRTTSKITTSVDDAAISEKDATIDRQDSAISEQKANAPYDPTELHGPHLHGAVATFVFVVTIVLLYFCIDATVGSIYALTTQKGLSETFVALILLPIPNCDFAPISLAIDDCVEETMKYTVGRSIQTALLVEPFIVLLAWWLGVGDVTLAFDGFEVVSLFTTILLLNFLVVDAKVHWVHGMLLLAEWVLIGIAAYFVTPEASS